MKMLSLVSLTVLAATIFSFSARGEEPDPSQIAKLTPQLQAMLKDLLKAADGDAADPAPAAPVAPAAVAPSTPTTPSRPAPASATSATSTAHSARSPRTSLGSTSLQTSSLRTGHLGASPSLTGAPRLNDDEWRQLFPQKK